MVIMHLISMQLTYFLPCDSILYRIEYCTQLVFANSVTSLNCKGKTFTWLTLWTEFLRRTCNLLWGLKTGYKLWVHAVVILGTQVMQSSMLGFLQLSPRLAECQSKNWSRNTISILKHSLHSCIFTMLQWVFYCMQQKIIVSVIKLDDRLHFGLVYLLSVSAIILFAIKNGKWLYPWEYSR